MKDINKGQHKGKQVSRIDQKMTKYSMSPGIHWVVTFKRWNISLLSLLPLLWEEEKSLLVVFISITAIQFQDKQ